MCELCDEPHTLHHESSGEPGPTPKAPPTRTFDGPNSLGGPAYTRPGQIRPVSTTVKEHPYVVRRDFMSDDHSISCTICGAVIVVPFKLMEEFGVDVLAGFKHKRDCRWAVANYAGREDPEPAPDDPPRPTCEHCSEDPFDESTLVLTAQISGILRRLDRLERIVNGGGLIDG